jgi:hypothetical protein
MDPSSAGILSTLGSSNLVCMSSVGESLRYEASRMIDAPPRSPFDANSELPAGDNTPVDESDSRLPRRPLAVKDSVVAIPRKNIEVVLNHSCKQG